MQHKILGTSTNLFVRDTMAALAFYEEVFAAHRLEVIDNEQQKSARISIGGSLFALADESPEDGAKSPDTLGGAPLCIELLVHDVDEFIDRALAAGSTIELPIIEVPGQYKFGNIKDPFGFVWSISQVY